MVGLVVKCEATGVQPVKILEVGVEDNLNDVFISDDLSLVTAGGTGRTVYVWDIEKNTIIFTSTPQTIYGKVDRESPDPIIRIGFDGDRKTGLALYERFGPYRFDAEKPDQSLRPLTNNRLGRSILWFDMIERGPRGWYIVSNLAQMHSSGGVSINSRNLSKPFQLEPINKFHISAGGLVKGFSKEAKGSAVKERGWFRLIYSTENKSLVLTKKPSASDAERKNNLQVLNDVTGEINWSTTIPVRQQNNLLLSKDESYLLVGSENTIFIYDILTGELYYHLTSPDYLEGRLAFSKDGKILAAAGVNKVILWDWEDIINEVKMKK